MMIILSAALIVGAPVETAAQRHGRGESHSKERTTENRRQPQHNNKGNRPGQRPPQHNNNRPSQRPPQNNNNRPSKRPPQHNNNNANRPGQRPPQHNNNANRPGQRPPQHNNNRPGQRPPQHNNHRPSQRPPQHNYRPNHRPPHGVAMRPGRPVPRPWVRPLPPPAWRPTRRVPFVRALFGLSFGLSFSQSLQQLYNSGYNVGGYDNNVIYINNVSELNYMWPEGIVYYGDNGLTRTQLYYATPGYNRGRYNAVYSLLSSRYGIPARAVLPGNGMQATWFASDGSFIQLEYSSRDIYDGGSNFVTTLTFGN